MVRIVIFVGMLREEKVLNKKQLIVAWVIVLIIQFSIPALAYFENYPPYKFKNGAPNHLKLEALVDFDKAEYKSKDGQVFVKFKETPDSLDFIVRDGNITLVQLKDKKAGLPLPSAVYKIDLDRNGLEDFIILYSYRGSGLAASEDRMEIYLKKNDKEYQKISYDTMSAMIEDFVDLNTDGKYEAIITNFYSGLKHNYFTYNIYEIKDSGLFNADSKFKGFPKFVWITDKPNDKDTTHLTKEERIDHTEKKDKSISYEIIK
ncbi:MAG: hypothetical protein KKA59_08445 [Candidatus Omnitrophica bacterium]|nr:hypothetical protein [Candidatus Omnitrophota bacterium]